MTYGPFARAKVLGGCAVALALSVAAVALDAGVRRAAHVSASPITRAAVRTLGTPDLALSSSSRWLRHPSQTEPGAPFADAPAALDTDPGGAVIGPPVELLGVGARRRSAEDCGLVERARVSALHTASPAAAFIPPRMSRQVLASGSIHSRKAPPLPSAPRTLASRVAKRSHVCELARGVRGRSQ